MPEPQTPETPATTPAVDLAAEVQKATSKLQQDFAAQLKEATGHDSIEAFKAQKLKDEGKLQELLDNKTKQADQYKSQFEQTQIHNALLSSSTDALDATVISDLLATKAVVDANGVVTINGKPAKDAVADLLKEKPFLAKASGAAGSGAPSSTSFVTAVDVSKMTPAQKMEYGRSNSTK